MRKKSLLALALALLSGLLFGEVFSFFPITLTCFVFILLLLEARFFQSRLLPLSIFFVWALGFLLYTFSPPPKGSTDLNRYLDQGSVRLIAEVSAPPRHRKKHVALRMKGLLMQNEATALISQPVHGFFQLFIWEKHVPFKYGDRLEMTVKLRSPNQYQNPGSFLYADYQERIGAQAMANLSSASQVQKIAEGGNPILKTIYRWREDIRKKILLSLDERTASILLAMVIGESGYLSDEMREIFVSSGIAHLLAVSGTHLAFVALFVFFCSRFLILRLPEGFLLKWTVWKIPSQWAAFFTAFAVSFYALLAGGRIGTLRALIMILAYLLSIWIGRQRDAQSSLALAALLILFAQPRALFEISFQLSFMAVFSMILFMNWWQNTASESAIRDEVPTQPDTFVKKGIKSFQMLWRSSFSAAIATAPLTLYYFHQFSWVGFISNLLLVPIAGWILIPFALLSAVLALFLPSFPFPQWHTVLWEIFNAQAHIFSRFPGAGLRFASPPLWLIALFYGSFFFLLIMQKSRTTFFVTVSLFFMIFLGWGSLRFPPEHLRVTFLDVGQGDASLVEFPNGKTLLIDGGTRRAGKYALAPYLWQRRIKKIDLLVVSHPQFDHIGGLPFILQKFKVDTVLSHENEAISEIHSNFLEALRVAGINRRIIGPEAATLQFSGCDLFFLPAFETSFPARNDLNNRSIVFNLNCPVKNRPPISFLFTGDIEAERERQLLNDKAILKSTVLKVPHHGSRSSSQSPFIEAVSPEIALFSVGRKNRYRHPHAKVWETYESAGITPLRTDQAGAVLIETRDGLHVKTFLEQKRQRIIWNKTLVAQEWDNMLKTFSALKGF